MKRVLHCGGLACAMLLVAAAALPAAGPPARLAGAVEDGRRQEVLKLLEQGANVNAAQADGMTALHWAVYHDDLRTAERLLDAGAAVEERNRYGVTPLSLAAQNGNAAMVRLLLEFGADSDSALPGGETALMTAARTGKIGAVRALLECGADVNRGEERRGQTALMWAAAEGHADVVQALIEAGADFRARLDSGFTPLLFGVRQGRMDAVRVLLAAGADVNEVIEPAENAPRGGPRAGTSALLLAAQNAHFDLGAFLLEKGADPNAQEPGFTVLHAIPSVRKPGVGDNDPPPEGSGAMTSLEFVRRLAAHGADLNARMTKDVNLGNTRLNRLEATPFLLAAHTADAELMRLLAELGADLLLPNAEGTTPLMAATGVGTRSPGEDAGTEEEVVEAVKAALELGADINAVNGNGETAMHGAAYKNLPKVVELLAEKGADIDVWYTKNRYGWTPLTIAWGYRFGNFKPSPVTVDALRRVMLAAGVEPPEKPEQAKSQEIY